MPICAIVKCATRNKADGSIGLFGLPTIIFHQGPQTEELSTRRRALWLARINRKFGNRELNGRIIKVCHKHFLNGRPAALYESSNPDWAPSINLGYDRKDSVQAKVSLSRYLRAKARQSNRSQIELVRSTTSGVEIPQESTDDRHVQTDGQETCQSPNRGVHISSSEDLSYHDNSCQPREITDDLEENLVQSDSGSTPADQQVDIDLCSKVIELSQENRLLKEQLSSFQSRFHQLSLSGHEQVDSELNPKFLEMSQEVSLLRDQLALLQSQFDQLTSQKRELQSERDSLQLDNVHLRQEVTDVRTRLKNSTISKEELEGDSMKAKFFTGLPHFDIAKMVYNLTESQVPHSKRSALPKFSEFLMALMRIRLGSLEQDLAYRFNVSQSTVSADCLKWIRAMAATLSKFIVWPERSILCQTMPSCFKEVFGDKVALIIDCFEIFIGRPSSLEPRAETWSQYKHHNTVKYLIGITPQGTVSFISNGYGGRSSDKFITTDSGILDQLAPGDVVLADRGFDIAEDVGLRRASLAIPAFTKGKDQLCFDDVQKTREIANLRIHVERMIGGVKRKFRILSGGPLHYTYFSEKERPLIDDIVKICCALTSLCPPIIPEEQHPSIEEDQNSLLSLLFANISSD